MGKASILGWFYAEVPKPKVRQGSVLSEEEMGQLKVAAKAMSLLNMDWSVPELKEAAESMFGVSISRWTAYQIRKRFGDQFSYRSVTDLSKNRMDPSTQNEVFKWLDQFEHFILSYKLEK